ncbi:MAG: lysophospholipid acyltransferase family protein [Dehalococcoidia bacterium]|nr:lysophospholipid acyltransferase family protein [Dehalococcoidia bacterium]
MSVPGSLYLACAAGVHAGLTEAALALFLAFRFAIFLTRMVPLRVSYGLARAVGVAAFYAWPGGRRRSIQNLRRVLGGDPREARRCARRSFGNYLVYLVDFFRFLGTDADEIRRRVVVEESLWERLREKRSSNGTVFLTMHFGNWDLGAAILALNGFALSAIADEFPNERVNRLVISSRKHLGMNIIPVGRMGPGILRALRNNDVVALLVDVPQATGGVDVEFFGATIRVSDGPARIALRAGSPVVAATLPRLDRWSDTVGAEIAPVAFDATGDAEADVRGLTQAVFTNLEGLVRRYPEQWYIFRNLWLDDRAPVRASVKA